MKRCPYCAEKIHDEAIACRYCGRDLVSSTINIEDLASKKISSSARKIEPVYISALKLTLFTYLLLFILPLVSDVISGQIDVELAWKVFSADFAQEFAIEFIGSVFTILLFRRLTLKGIHPIFKWIICIVVWLVVVFSAILILSVLREYLFG